MSVDSILKPGDLIKAIVAVPGSIKIVKEDGTGVEREVAYTITNPNIGEPLEVLASANAWWLNPTKVEKLMVGFGADMTVGQACYSAEISERQYYYFLKINPDFCRVKAACEAGYMALTKLVVRKQVAEGDGSLGFRIMQGVEPEKYRRSVLPDAPPGGGGYARRTHEVFMDEKGVPVMSRETAEYIQQYGDGSGD